MYNTCSTLQLNFQSYKLEKRTTSIQGKAFHSFCIGSLSPSITIAITRNRHFQTKCVWDSIFLYYSIENVASSFPSFFFVVKTTLLVNR